DIPQQAGAHQVEDREQLLGGEETVRYHAHEEGRNQRRDGCGAVRQTDLGPGEMEGLSQVGAHGDEPRPPNEVLEEHHDRETASDAHLSTRILILRYATRSP